MNEKNIVLIWSLFFIGLFICEGQEINHKTIDTQGREKLLGVITKEGMTRDTFAHWFDPQYEKYVVDEEALGTIKAKLKKYKILAFMGTWCGDSRREIPRFYKILKNLDYPMDNLTMVAVDNTRENYKKSPTGEERGYKIIKVPTFILLKGGKEVNRIVESPKNSLEKDLHSILMNAPYTPNYKIVPID